MKHICRTLLTCAFTVTLSAAALPASAATQTAKPATAQQQNGIPTPQQAARLIRTAITELTQTLTHIQDKATADTEAARVSVLFDMMAGSLILAETGGEEYATAINGEVKQQEIALKQQMSRLREQRAYSSRLLGMAMPLVDFTTLPELTEEDRAAQRRLQESEQARLPELLKAVHDETTADAAAIAISTLMKRALMVRRTQKKAKTLRFIESQLPLLLKGSEAEVERLRQAECFGSILLKPILMPQEVKVEVGCRM